MQLPRCDHSHHVVIILHISAVTRACVPSGLHFVGFHGTSFKDDGEDTVIASLYKDPTIEPDLAPLNIWTNKALQISNR